MVKWTRRLAMCAVLGLVVGCGGGGGTDTATLASRLVGTWRLDRQSSDSGANFTNVTNGFSFTFNANGTWTDTDGSSGSWLLNSNRLTIIESGQSNIDATVSLDAGDTRLTITFFTNDSFQQTTGNVSIYIRTS